MKWAGIKLFHERKKTSLVTWAVFEIPFLLDNPTRKHHISLDQTVKLISDIYRPFRVSYVESCLLCVMALDTLNCLLLASKVMAYETLYGGETNYEHHTLHAEKAPSTTK